MADRQRPALKERKADLFQSIARAATWWVFMVNVMDRNSILHLRWRPWSVVCRIMGRQCSSRGVHTPVLAECSCQDLKGTCISCSWFVCPVKFLPSLLSSSGCSTVRPVVIRFCSRLQLLNIRYWLTTPSLRQHFVLSSITACYCP